jgi:hypothetical protein
MEINIKDYAPKGTKDCEFACNKAVIMTDKGPVVVCHFCKRIIRETNINR